MHEYSIVGALIDQVQRQAACHHNARVCRLKVRIGELSGVDIGLLRTAYDTFREKTLCDEAEMDIEPVAARWECPICGKVFEPGARLRCADCARPARLTQGDEIILAKIEMEVPDV